jgi:hypothetical protein
VNDQLELVIVGLSKRNVPILGQVLPVESSGGQSIMHSPARHRQNAPCGRRWISLPLPPAQHDVATHIFAVKVSASLPASVSPIK